MSIREFLRKLFGKPVEIEYTNGSRREIDNVDTMASRFGEPTRPTLRKIDRL